VSNDRKKIVFLSDHPLAPSGVGTQAKYLIEGLLRTGKYQFFCLGGAIRHPDYRMQQIAPEEYGEGSWIILPVDGHGNKDVLRKVLREERPDAVVMFTDPRFFTWVWEMEDEVRAQCPLLYWHVWDNDPVPEFNRAFYESTDFISCLSLKTYGLLQGIGYPADRFNYIPHAEPEDLFKPLPEEEVLRFKLQNYGRFGDPKSFIVFWNNRNARRKHPGDVVAAFKLFLDEVGHDRAALMMHTNIRDEEGQDVLSVARKLGIEGNMIFSTDMVEPSQLNMFYNVADVTINLASNEGFGLTTLESIFAGTPIVANFTGGLQYQTGDWWKDVSVFTDQDELTRIAKKSWNRHVQKGPKSEELWWGAPVFPEVRSLMGSQQVPYIYDDHSSNEQVARAIHHVFKMGRKNRKTVGAQARSWALKRFGMAGMIQSWDTTLSETIEKHKRQNLSIRSCTL
jgi:glycosyltransferase involved in cell wall biosynthesis